MSMPGEEIHSLTYPLRSDPQRVLLVKLIIAEGGGSGGGGGGGIQQIYYNAGNPNGVVTPTAASVGFPLICIDTNTGQIYQKTDLANTNTGWV